MLKERKVNQNFIIWVVGISLLIGLGYWYGARPYLAAKNCHGIALDNTGYSKDDWRMWAGNSKTQTDYMFVYGLCMHKEGFNF